ncbi:MAG: hypothetical protein J5720_07050 [Bacteroidaceae bacterium]|nr:hypothetical protein [Bacteroidaceae bacterium]
MKQLITCALLCFLLPASAQQFTVFHDTIHIDGRLFGQTPIQNVSLRAAESSEGLYLLIHHRESMENWGENELLFVDKNSHKVSNIKLPELPIEFTEFRNTFIRHDSLILKANAFHESDISFYERARRNHDKEDMKAVLNYSLDTRTGRWKPIKSANDLIYEDDSYRICYKEYGEWGTYLVFQEWKKQERHLYRGCGRLLKIGGSYYLVSQYRISKIDNPKNGVRYTTDSRDMAKLQYASSKPEVVLDLEDLVMPKDTDIPRAILRTDPLIPSPPISIYAAFVHEDKPYLIMRSSDGLYVASFKDGALHKEMDLGCNYRSCRLSGFELRENNRPDNQAFLECKDESSGNSVILTVEGTCIHLWYLIIEN